jgi:hypothetical protein
MTPPRDDRLAREDCAIGLAAIARASHADGHAVIARIRAATACGFLTPTDVRMLAADVRTRLQLVLVRCGGCRFTAPAQDVQRLIDIIEREGRDYVRDVSLPASAHRQPCPACGQRWDIHDCPGEAS